MSNWYVSSIDYAAVAQFAVSHAYSVGDIVRQLATPAVGSERAFRCTTAGTSAGTEAAWTLTKGSTTTQGTAIFTEVTGNETYQAAGAWAAPHARLGNAFASGWMAAGDTCYVAANHAESTSAGITCTVSTATLTSIICVDNSGTGHVPPIAGDTRTTASVTVAGSFNTFQIGMALGYVYGLIMISNGSSCALSLGLNNGYTRLDSCELRHAAAASTQTIAGSYVEWNNVKWSAFSGTNSIQINGAEFKWRATPTATGSVATGTGIVTDAAGALIVIDGVDFSAVGHTRIITPTAACVIYSITGCRLNASTAITSQPLSFSTTVDGIAIDSGGATYRNERWGYNAILTTEIVVVHTGGASDGTTSESWKIVTNTNNASWRTPFETFAVGQWNTTTGSAKTVSLETLSNTASILTNEQLWMDVLYLGTASSTLNTTATTAKADVLATAINNTASTATWTATARANSTGYSLGAPISVSSNVGMVFFCTTGGTSSSSLPAGYATAIDGGSVTDGTAVFRAGWRMTLSVSVTPRMAGLIRAQPKVGVISTTLYIDPKLTVS